MRNILFILFIVLVLAGCEQKITDAFAYSGILEVSESEMQFNAGAYSKTIEVKGVMEWDIDTSLIEPWCKVMPVKNYNGREYLTAFVDSNEVIDNRQTKFHVVNGTQKVEINVIQLGNIPQVLFGSDSLVIGVNKNLLKIDFVTNIEYEMSVNADWFQVNEEVYQGDKRLLIAVSENSTAAERKGVITFKHKDGTEKWEWTFRQLDTNVPYELNEVDKLDPNLKVLPVSATASSEAEGKGIEKSYDGDKLNYYQSTYQNESEPVVLEYRFDGASPIDYLCYVPYEGDTEKSFKDVEIWVEQEGGEYELVKTHLFQISGEQIVVFENTIEKPAGIKFVVKSSYDTEEHLLVAACAEMEFYSASMRYKNIFADPVYGSLQNDVTLDQIFAIEDPVFRNIAYHLFYNTYEDGRIINCPSYPDVRKYYLTFNGSYGGLDNVTGITVKAGNVIPIFADKIKQEVVYATVFNPKNAGEMKRYRLYDGVNKITVDCDGHLYINFTSMETKDINIHIAGGAYNGYYDLSKEMDYDLSNSESSSYMDVVGDHAHLLFKKEHLQGRDLASLIACYDKIVGSQQLFMGLEKYGQEVDNRILFLEVSDKFNINYQNHYVQCPELDIEKLTDVQQITGKILWDLALEVGTIHSHIGIMWKGVTFTTPKLFALATQQAFGQPLNIDVNNWYSDAFSSILIPEEKLANLPDDFNDYPEKIVPFWQLQLYATQVLGKGDLYKDVLFKARKMGNVAVEYFFIQYVQDALQLDLTRFFKRWGFSTAVYNTYPKAPEALVYLSPRNIQQFIAGSALPSASGYFVTNGRVMVFNPRNVVAYLVRHDFVPMQVFDAQVFQVQNWKESMRIYALGVDGTEVELSRW